MRKFLKGVAVATVAVAFVALAGRASASTVVVTNEAGIVNDGNLSWGALGTAFTVVSNPFTLPVPGVAGLTITGSQAGQTTMERRDQGNGWSGNFGNGEQLLWTDGSNGPMTFVFNNPISGFGAQIQSDAFGAFTAIISAFDSSNNLLGIFTLNGNSTNAGDDSAIFIGILSSALDISRIVLSAPTAGIVQDFAINSPRIQTTGTAVPEPASMLLIGTGLAGLAARRRARKA